MPAISRTALFGVSLLLLSGAAAYGQAPLYIGWEPVTEAERKLQKPVVDPTAGLEAIFWKQYVADELQGQDFQRIIYHYLRLKVFNEAGKEQAATVELYAGSDVTITAVDGRTTKPDGTVLDLPGSAVQKRAAVKTKGLKRTVTSFAMPGVEPGVIVEYRWKEIYNKPQSLYYVRLPFSREVPVQKVTHFVRPLPREWTSARMKYVPFNCNPSAIQQDMKGFSFRSLDNVPAFKGEPMMPGDAFVRPWSLVYYTSNFQDDPNKYWDGMGKNAYKEVRTAARMTAEMKQAAEAAVAGAADDEAKVLALIRYIRKNFRGLFESTVTDAERVKVIKEMDKGSLRTSEKVFDSKIGTADQLNSLFAAMASHVGLDARPAFVADRNDLPFDQRMTDLYFLPNIDMAVKIGDKWKVYDVSTRLLPPEMISWSEEGQPALLSDPKKPEFIDVPFSAPSASAVKSTAKMTLSADGVLEGDVEQSYTGHLASDRRVDMRGETKANQEEELTKEITGTFKNAEVTAISIDGIDDYEKPVTVRYHIKVPGYAQRTGKRLILQPLYFRRGEDPMFSASERRYDVHFHHAWHEKEEVNIALPAGFALDNAESPGGAQLGPTGEYKLDVFANNQQLRAVRELIFGNKGLLVYPAQSYVQVKGAFDEIHRRDNFMISLKQAGN